MDDKLPPGIKSVRKQGDFNVVTEEIGREHFLHVGANRHARRAQAKMKARDERQNMKMALAAVLKKSGMTREQMAKAIANRATEMKSEESAKMMGITDRSFLSDLGEMEYRQQENNDDEEGKT